MPKTTVSQLSQSSTASLSRFQLSTVTQPKIIFKKQICLPNANAVYKALASSHYCPRGANTKIGTRDDHVQDWDPSKMLPAMPQHWFVC